MEYTLSSIEADNAMLRQWKDGDEQGFTALYMKYSITLLKIAYNKTGIKEYAEELVQDTFLTFYRHSDAVINNPITYLKKILQYKILDYFKQSKITTAAIKDEHLNGSYFSNDITEDIKTREMADEIKYHIQRLPSQCRNVFLLSRQEELPNKEIAERLGITVKAVEANITRALKYLRESLDYHWAWWIPIGFLNICVTLFC